MTITTPPSTLLELLGRELPADRIVVDPDVLAGLSHDEAEWAAVGRAAVGVRAGSEAEVQTAVRLAAASNTPVVPRGAGTGLSGGANAVEGCLVLDVSRMDAQRLAWRKIVGHDLTVQLNPGRAFTPDFL